jgi:hypothetical protein
MSDDHLRADRLLDAGTPNNFSRFVKDKKIAWSVVARIAEYRNSFRDELAHAVDHVVEIRRWRFAPPRGGLSGPHCIVRIRLA